LIVRVCFYELKIFVYNSCLSAPAEFNLINELSRHVESEEEFLNELKITSSDTDFQSIQLDNSECGDAKEKSVSHMVQPSPDIKDCCVYLNRLEDSVIDAYLNKFENKYNGENSDYMMGEDIVDEMANEGKLSSTINFIFRVAF